MQIARLAMQMIVFVMSRTDDFALHIRYLSERGDITERTIVPLSLQGNLHLRAICVSSEEFRTFRLARILDVKIRLSCDVLIGHEQVRKMMLIGRRVDKSTETEATSLTKS